MSNYAPPANPPAHRSDSLSNDPIHDEPPPAYTPAAGEGDTTVQSGPSHVDFSGPPPTQGRLEQNITGVGIGYGRRPQPSTTASWGGPQSPSMMGGGASGQSFRPPPSHPSRADSQYASSPSSRPTGDLSPTEVPTPGRPLLNRGQMLVYPVGHFCNKCGNTGYKANDPSNPCSSDWRKYGKAFNSALAHSYTFSTGPSSNPSTNNATNFQRPLPSFAPQPSTYQPPQAQQNPYGHLPPPPGKWDSYPGQHAPHHHPPHPHPQQQHQEHQSMMHPPQPMMHHPPQPGPIFVQHTPGPVPPGAVVVVPGDPRIGGRPCHRCGGTGRELSFFGFDDGRCWECHGLGRLF